jgi:hypothetical protein
MTFRELETLAHIMDHFTDYMARDDRPDHGFGILKGYRDLSDEDRREVFVLAGRLMRRRRLVMQREYNEKQSDSSK